MRRMWGARLVVVMEIARYARRVSSEVGAGVWVGGKIVWRLMTGAGVLNARTSTTFGSMGCAIRMVSIVNRPI